MIHPKEINAVAKKYKLKDTQIEKDYVLSWLLLGISRNAILCDNLAFKGGTVLKKVYFPEYRFSEDLDFTLLDNDLPEGSFSLKCYPLEEILIEKMAALMGRTEPRDLYDFWHLTESERLDTGHLKPEFERKAMNKGHDFRLFEQKVLEKEKNLSQAWQRKLQDQVYDLPKFADVFRESKRHFKL
jgi:predicted nucleotidyltransferase component of viral defense system